MDDFQFDRVKRGAEAPAADPLRDDFRKRIVGDEAEVINRMCFLAGVFGAETSAAQTKVVMSYFIDLLQKSGALIFDTSPDEDPARIVIPDYVRAGTISSLLVWMREVTEKAKAAKAAADAKQGAVSPAAQPLPVEQAKPAPRAPAPVFSLSEEDLAKVQKAAEAPEQMPVEAAPDVVGDVPAQVAEVVEPEEDGDAKNQLPMPLDHPVDQVDQAATEHKDVDADSRLDGNQDQEERVTEEPVMPDFKGMMARKDK